MKSDKIFHSLIYLWTGSAILAFANSALADPPNTPQATDRMSFSGTVGLECSVDIPSQFTQNGGVPLTNDVAYAITSPLGGGNGDINDGTPLEQRITRLQATDSTTFDCNSNTASYSINLTTLTAPDFTNAENIDLVVLASTGKGVDHKVGITIKYPDPVCPFIFCQETSVQDINTSSELDTVTLVSNPNVPLDLNGDVKFELTSRFETIGGAEELGAGLYNAQFTVTVTAL